jgi:hypothetical protein
MANQRNTSEPLTRKELVALRRAAEDAIQAMNPRHGPFVDLVANPLKMLALVDMAMRSIETPSTSNNNQN